MKTKTHYFFVKAEIGFEKEFPTKKEFPEKTDRSQFTYRKIIGIDQPQTVSDEIFYNTLMKKINERIEEWSGSWISGAETTKTPTDNYKWKLSKLLITGVSRVSP